MSTYSGFGNNFDDYSMGSPAMAPLGTTGGMQQNAINAQVNMPQVPQGVMAAITPQTGVAGSAAPLPGAAGGGGGPGFFSQGGGAGLILGGIQTLGSLWNSFQQNKLAKKSLALQTRAFETNLKNTTQSYNTALEDRIRARYNTEGRSEQADSYIDRNKL